MLVEVGGVAIYTYINRNEYWLHLHHYFWAGLIIPLLNYRHNLTAVFLGFFTALMVEGIARWGIDPVWKSVNYINK